MFRKHETTVAWKAGLLAVLVHVVLVGIMLFSFQWKAAHTVVSVSEVELWSELPNKSQSVPQPKPPTVEPEPEPEVKKEPEPMVEPEPEPEEPKVDIELENKKKKEAEKKKLEEEKKKAEKKKKKLALEKKKKKRKQQLDAIKKAALEEELDPNKKAREDALKKLQQAGLEEQGSEDAKRASAASQGVVDQYIAKIQAKVRGNVNKSLCADGNPEPQFKISLLPNGEFSGKPTLAKSSGNAVCDDAVERAIMASEPFPLPTDPNALARFRDLNLKFKPNAK